MSTIREPQLAHVRVHDAMHTGILSTDPSTPLRVVARLMAEARVHAIAVADEDHVRRPWGIVTALDVAAAAAGGDEETAGSVAATEVLTVTTDEPLDHAAQQMAEHGLNHLIVVDPLTGHPVGIVSSLDIAGVYGGI